MQRAEVNTLIGPQWGCCDGKIRKQWWRESLLSLVMKERQSDVLGVGAYWLALLIKHIVWANPQSILSAEHQESFLQWADRSFSMWVLSVRVQSLMDSPRGGEMKCHPYWRAITGMLQSITPSTWAQTFKSF